MSDQKTREALAAFIDEVMDGDAGTNVGPGLAEAILSRFAVTPKDGTEWEYGLTPSEPVGNVEPSTIRDISAKHLAWQRTRGNSIVRRRKAGPWEPVPAGEGSD